MKYVVFRFYTNSPDAVTKEIEQVRLDTLGVFQTLRVVLMPTAHACVLDGIEINPPAVWEYLRTQGLIRQAETLIESGAFRGQPVGGAIDCHEVEHSDWYAIGHCEEWYPPSQLLDYMTIIEQETD